MGERGQVVAPAHLRIVSDGKAAQQSTAADTVPKLAPLKPQAVIDSAGLSALWDSIVPQLDECGLLSPADGPAVELALRHFLLARVASDQLGETKDVTVADRDDSVKKHPAEAVFRAESEMFLRYATQLGMTFVARARVPAAKGGDGGDENPFGAPVR